MNTNYRISLKIVFLILAFIFFLFAPYINGIIGGIFNYLDELFALIAVVGLIIRYKKIKKIKCAKQIILSLIVLSFMGIISSITARLNTNFFSCAIDAFGLMKNHMIFLYISFCVTSKQKSKVFKSLLPLLKLLVVVSFVCGMLNLVSPNIWAYDVRFGIHSFKFFFDNPASLGMCMFVGIAFFDVMGSNRIYKYLAIIVTLLTLRSGLIAGIVIYLIVSFFLNHNKDIKIRHLVIVGMGSIIAAWTMIKEYFLSGSLRALLYKYGFKTMCNYFPLGSGYSTFGGNEAFVHYSSLYYQYGFNSIWGFSKDTGQFLNDNYWPMIIAQFGVIGLMCNLITFLSEAFLINNYCANKIYKINAWTLFLILLTGTIVSSNMTNVTGTLTVFSIGLLLNSEKR